MAWTKERVLTEFRRATERNGGRPVGQRAFKKLVRDRAWRGRFWARYGDLVSEAGYQPNVRKRATNPAVLLENFIPLIRKLSRFPTGDEQVMERRANPSFPSPTVVRKRFGSQEQLVEAMYKFCSERLDFADIEDICSRTLSPAVSDQASPSALGHVYLIRSGRHYKIGRTNSAGRRGYEIGLQLPERHRIVHHFETDDPVGIEAYWHRRFESKRGNGEWFDLSATDVLAFKRRKKFM